MKKSTLSYKKDKKDKWRWNLQASNGTIVAASSQGFARLDNCVRNAKNTQKGLALVFKKNWVIKEK